MNERAREVLVAAALNGVRQSRWSFRDDKGGRCAMAVLIDAWSEDARLGHRTETQHVYSLTEDELREIVRANDRGWDFLTIARKVGVNEAHA